MLSHHPAKFGGHRHCSGGDMFLVVEEQDITLRNLRRLIWYCGQPFITKAGGHYPNLILLLYRSNDSHVRVSEI